MNSSFRHAPEDTRGQEAAAARGFAGGIAKRARQNGVALVLTLAILGILSLLVIGFLVSMRTEQTAARNNVYVTVSRQLAQGAIDDAIYLMRANMPLLSPTNSFSTMAGLAAPWGTTSPQSNLFSVSGSGTIDLNSDGVIFPSNNLYSTSLNRQIVVNWMNVLTSGTNVTSGTAIPTTVPIMGRYAFWVDDEASKMNINSANQRIDILGGATSNVDLTVLNGVLSATANASATFAQTSGYVTVEQWQETSAGGISSLEQQNQFYLTPYSTDSGQTPWGTQKFYLNTNQVAFQSEIDNCGTNSLGSTALTNWFGANGTFVAKYGTNIVKQMMANMCDYRFNASTPCTGSGYLDTGFGGTWGIPSYYLGLKLFPFLNEIAILPTYSWVNGPGTQLQVQLWVFAELVNPYSQAWGSGGSIKIDVDKLYYRVNSQSNGLYNVGVDGGWNQEIEIPIANVPANLYSVIITNVTIADAVHNPEIDTNAFVDVVEVRMNKVRLLQAVGTDNTIRDWAQWNDFNQYAANTGGGAPPLGSQPNHFIFAGTNRIAQSSIIPATNSVFLQGIAKNDPRVRNFVQWTPPLPAWYRVGDLDTGAVVPAGPTISSNVTLGAQNSVVNMTSGTGISNVSNDPIPAPGLPAATNVVTSPSFYMNTSTSDVPYQSVGELGYIHSGLQWRTIQLQPCPSSEFTNSLPDWAILDICSVTNGPVQGRVNINCYVTNLNTSASPARTIPLEGVLTAITPANNMGVATDQGAIATNIYDLAWANASATGWGANRSTGGRTFTPGFFNMIGELCEINTISTNWNSPTYVSKFASENRIRSFANLVTTRSDTFTVWAIAQAIQQVNPNGYGVFTTGDVVLAESKAQAVVQRYEQNGQVSFRTLYFRYLTP